MTLAQSITRVAQLVATRALTSVDENALTTVRLRCTDNAYGSTLVASLLAAVATAVAALEADAAFGDLAIGTTDALDALEAAAAACVSTPGGA